MNPNQSKNHLPDFDPDLENDALWTLLKQSSPPEIPPRLVSDTLRKIRLAESSPSPWWRKLLSPKPFLAASASATAALAIFLSLPDQSANPTPQNPDTLADHQWNDLEDSFATELLAQAADDPSLLSDADIIALLF